MTTVVSVIISMTTVEGLGFKDLGGLRVWDSWRVHL